MMSELKDGYERAWQIEWIAASRLQVDERYQNPVNAKRVAGIAAHFNPMLFRPLDVSRRLDGSLYVVDGRHRLEAIRLRGEHHRKMECRVYRGLSLKQEAQFYLDIDGGQTKKKSGYRFRTEQMAGEPEALAIASIVADAGYELSLTSTKHDSSAIGCVTLLRQVFRYGPAHLANVLALIRLTWGDAPKATDQGIVQGVHASLLLHRDAFDARHFIARLKRHSPTEILTEATTKGGAANNKRFHNVYVTLLAHYNYRTPEAKQITIVPRSLFPASIRDAKGDRS